MASRPLPKKTPVLLLGLVLLLAAPAGAAEVGILLSSDRQQFKRVLTGFKSELQRLRPSVGYDTRYLEENGDDRSDGIPEGWARKKTLVLALGTATLGSSLLEGRDTPQVVSMVLSKKDIRRAGNATGVALEFGLETRFAWLQGVLPQARRVGVIYNAEENGEYVDSAARVAQQHGIKLIRREVATARDIPAALESLTNSVDTLWGISDSIVMTPETAQALLLFSYRNRIPFVGLSGPWVKAGALYALERNYLDVGKQCAELADKVLGGEPATSLPPQAPRKVELMINLRTARQMKIDIPERLRRKAKTLYR